jgi:hypothetical protein
MVNTRARPPWLALRPKEGSQATNPRIACLRRQAGVGRATGRALRVHRAVEPLPQRHTGGRDAAWRAPPG